MTGKALITIFALLYAGGAAIASTEALPTVRVSYADLDLSLPGDVAKLHRRAERAVREVCGEVMATPFELRDLVIKCSDAARSRAAVQIVQAIDRSTRQASLRSTVAAR